MSQKNKLGLSLNRKKGLFGQKVNAYVILEQLLNYKIPPFHCLSEANAWASVHALSMVTWYNQNIVNGYHLIMFTHLFKAESAINEFILRSESSQNYLIFLFPREWKKKLGLRWAKLSSSWDLVLFQLICIINKNVPKMGQPSNNNNKDRNNINWLWILKMGWFWKFISFRSIPF